MRFCIFSEIGGKEKSEQALTIEAILFRHSFGQLQHDFPVRKHRVEQNYFRQTIVTVFFDEHNYRPFINLSLL